MIADGRCGSILIAALLAAAILAGELM